MTNSANPQAKDTEEAGQNDRLIMLGGAGGVVAGLLGLVPMFYPHREASAPHEFLYALIDFGLLFAIVAIWLKHGSRIGRIGLVGFVVALAACASILGPDAQMFGIDFYALGSMVFAVGMSLLGFAMLRANAMRLPSAIWIASLVLGLIATSLEFAEAGLFIGIFFKLGFLAAGIDLISRAQVQLAPA